MFGCMDDVTSMLATVFCLSKNYTTKRLDKLSITKRLKIIGIVSFSVSYPKLLHKLAWIMLNLP